MGSGCDRDLLLLGSRQERVGAPNFYVLFGTKLRRARRPSSKLPPKRIFNAATRTSLLLFLNSLLSYLAVAQPHTIPSTLTVLCESAAEIENMSKNSSSKEVAHYVATAHPPGGVLKAIKCNFLAPDSEVRKSLHDVYAP